jgi:hypothetical protein
MTAQVLKMRRPSIARLACTRCGAETDASCNCGEPYLPAGARAAKAIAKSPEKSDRAIATEIGVSAPTVGKARKATVKDFTVGRIGKDGKRRRLPQAAPRVARYKDLTLEMPTEAEAEKSYQQTIYDQACLLLEAMADATRRKFFAHIRGKYHEN